MKIEAHSCEGDCLLCKLDVMRVPYGFGRAPCDQTEDGRDMDAETTGETARPST